MRKLEAGRDAGNTPVNLYWFPDDDEAQAYLLVAATNKQVTVPASARYAMFFCAETDVWFRYNGAAVVPTGDDASGASIPLGMIPGCRVVPGETLNFIQTAGGALVAVMFYA